MTRADDQVLTTLVARFSSLILMCSISKALESPMLDLKLRRKKRRNIGEKRRTSCPKAEP
jgi:hypothetical protein